MAGPLAVGVNVFCSGFGNGIITADDGSANYTVLFQPGGPGGAAAGNFLLSNLAANWPAGLKASAANSVIRPRLIAYAGAVASPWTGSATSLTATATVSGGAVTSVSLTNTPAGTNGLGAGGPYIGFLWGGGANAAATLTGTTVTVTNGGVGFTSAPIVFFL